MTSLPTLRRKILRSFSVIVLLYAGLGFFLVVSVFLASATTPKMLHLNYDSIAASHQMEDAWSALDRPDRYPDHPVHYWMEQFEKALLFEEGNITEPGEKENASEIRKSWEEYKKIPSPLPLPLFTKLNTLLAELVKINEKGMFELTEENASLSRRVLMGSVIYFFVTLILALILADGLANRLSSPLKSIAEALQRRPGIGRRLKLIEPNSLEIFILCNELKRLWDQVVATERINVKELVKQKNQLETVLESVEDALLVVDGSGKVSHYNNYLLSLLGLTKAQIKDQSWKDLPTAKENYLKLRLLLKEDMPDAEEIELQLEGRPRQYAARFRKIRELDNLPGSTLFLLHDITERKQRARFRSDFIDLLSHEIKTPLQSLGTASDFLVAHKNEIPQSLLPFFETIPEDLERIKAVANEFIQITHTHSKILRLNLDFVPLNECLQEWLKPFKVVSKDRNVQLTFHQEGSAVIWAQIDKVKFPWVISNLLSNAIRFAPVDSEVEVLLTDRNDSVEIRVMDEGPGISEEDQHRMFEPFYQGSRVTPSGKTGLFGIGLTIAKEVVEAHDGRIEYFLRKPVGSEFRILLPYPPQNYT